MAHRCLGLLMMATLLIVSGCNGPANPERNGRAWLEREGHPKAVIDAVLQGNALPADTVALLSRCANADVRYLLGINPTLTAAQIDVLINDSNHYARSGSARNPHLTLAQMERLFKDPSHTVYASLASNPEVPPALLLKLRAERPFPSLVPFALNPACPPEIVAEIEHSNDEQSLYWLKWTRERNKTPTKPSP